MDSTLMPAATHMQTSGSMMSANGGALTPGASGTLGNGTSSNTNGNGNGNGNGSSNGVLGNMSYGDANYDFFDPQHWMLDGLLDFNYSFTNPIEGQ